MATIAIGTRSVLGFLKTTLVGGLVFLVPVLVFIVLVVKVVELLRKLAQPLAAHLPVQTAFGVIAADVVVIVLLVLACFLAGLLARVSFANRSAARNTEAPRFLAYRFDLYN
jgi:uncharacterized membrane protein